MLDLSERMRTEDALREARDHALEANRAKSVFLANMSHELRTPLNAIIGYSEMLQEHADEAQDASLGADLKRIYSSGKHLLSLINDVLDLSKIEAGKMELFVSRFEICPLVADVSATVHPLLEKNANRLVVDCPPTSGTMEADETKVRQIVLNLVSNALKFTENGEISVSIVRENDDWVSFCVSDTGIGMDPRQLSLLFQDFTQVDASTTRRHGGTGLGLAISRKFCHMMGGEITVRSEIGVGSTFTARIPATVFEKHADKNRESSLYDNPLERPGTYSPNTILVIDDEPAVHDLMRRTLEKEGFQVVGALDGRRGIELARELQPRAITLDVLMPDIDGWSVLQELKSDPRVSDIPVIIASIIDDRKFGFALGASDYLMKPIERERLLTALKRHKCDLRHCNVLVIEDNLDTRELVERLLISAGCSTTTADNGRLALIALEQSRPDLIMLDLMMPEMDGFQFLDNIRRIEQYRTIPIIVVTAKELTQEDRQRMSGHVNQVLQKGEYSREDLLREVCELIGVMGPRNT